MDLQNLKSQYELMTTDQLKDLAEDYRDMRRDAIPVLFDELNNRGESEFVEIIKFKMSQSGADKNEATQGIFGNLADSNPMNFKHTNPVVTEEAIDEHDVFNEDLGGNVDFSKNTNLSENEIVSQAVRKILKNKSKLKSKSQTLEFMENNWYINEYITNSVFKKLKSKMNMAYTVFAIILVLTVVGIMMFISSEGEVGFAPGLLLIVLAIINLNNASQLNKILNR